MCIENYHVVVLEEDTIAYKVVHKDGYSNYLPRRRLFQEKDGIRYRDRGECLHYPEGDVVFSPIPETPGLYCYTTLDAAALCAEGSQSKIIKVFIPKGTTAGAGMNGYSDVLCPEILIVMGDAS